MARHNVYRDGFVHVLSEKCSTCIFRPGNLMHLHPGRVKGMVEETLEDESSSIVCHQTLGTKPKRNAVCRGWYDSYANRQSMFQIASRLGIIKEVEAPHGYRPEDIPEDGGPSGPDSDPDDHAISDSAR